MRKVLILLALAALLAAGCGGGSKSGAPTGATTAPATTVEKPAGPRLTKAQYTAKLKQIAAEIAGSLGGTSSGQKLTKGDVSGLVDAIHRLTSRLAEINPPAEIEALHGRLITALNDLADEFPGIADQLNKAKDASAGIAALFGAKAVQELTQVQAALKAKGYNLNLSG